MANLDSNVKGLVESVKHSENGFEIQIKAEDGGIHDFRYLTSANVQESDSVNVGDLLGVHSETLWYYHFPAS